MRQLDGETACQFPVPGSPFAGAVQKRILGDEALALSFLCPSGLPDNLPRTCALPPSSGLDLPPVTWSHSRGTLTRLG
jgi:hypothetical protein